MVPFYQWRDRIIYAVFIYGGQYVAIVSWYTSFEDVSDAVREHTDQARERDGQPLIVISATFAQDDQAAYLVDEELVTLSLGRE